jgi:hypothetical protein
MMPTLIYNENEIAARLIINRPLKQTEWRDGRFNVGCEFIRQYDPERHVIEILIRNK